MYVICKKSNRMVLYFNLSQDCFSIGKANGEKKTCLTNVFKVHFQKWILFERFLSGKKNSPINPVVFWVTKTVNHKILETQRASK